MTTDALTAYQRVADQQKRDALILSHLPLVKHVIGRLVGELPPGVDVENLEAAGVLGLVEAAGKYDPGRNTLFKTFAYIRIRGAVLDELRRASPLPQQMLERVSAVRKALASGVPVVAFQTGPAAECINHDRTGLLARPGSGKLVAAVERLAIDPDLRERLAANARASVAGRTWADDVEELVGRYGSLARDLSVVRAGAAG